MKYIKQLAAVLRTTAVRFKTAWLDSYGGTCRAVQALSETLAGVVCGVASLDLGIPPVSSFLLVFAAVVLLLKLSFFIIDRLQRIIFRINIMSVVYAAPVAVIMTGAIAYGFYNTEAVYIYVLCGLVCTAALCVAAASWYAVLKRRVRTRLVFVMLAVSVSLSGVVMYAVFWTGSADSYVQPYLEMAAEAGYLDGRAHGGEQRQDGGYDYSRPEYGVGVIDFGPSDKLNNDIINFEPVERSVFESDATVNLTSFAGGYSGLNKWYRDKCLGYPLSEVPLRGRIYYPVNEGKSPVVFLIHGNHTFVTPSYLGYDYLGGYLAGAGYIVVSIDSNACNGNSFSRLYGENDARAVLLLEHIGWLEEMCRDSAFPLCGMADFKNIILAGHSRGGEAAAIAALFNEYGNHPDNGRIIMDFDYDIRAVVAIAPTVDQYMPAGHEVGLEDISYLLIQGANDQDLAEYYGMERYNTVSFTGSKDCLKTALYIAGANHGQFNGLWGRYDLSMPAGIMLNTANLIPEEAQQEIFKRYVRAFLDAAILGDTGARELLYDCRPLSEISDTVYIQNYMASDFRYICSFEEDSNLSTATEGSVSITTSGASYWAESMMHYSETGDGGRRENHALNFEWPNDAEFTMEMQGYDMSEGYFQFDICSTDDASVLRGEYGQVGLSVSFTDAEGETAVIDAQRYGFIYPPLPVRLGKLQYFLDEISPQHQLQTIRIPVRAFTEDNPALDLHDIRSVSLRFSGSGRVLVDNIGIGS